MEKKLNKNLIWIVISLAIIIIGSIIIINRENIFSKEDKKTEESSSQNNNDEYINVSLNDNKVLHAYNTIAASGACNSKLIEELYKGTQVDNLSDKSKMLMVLNYFNTDKKFETACGTPTNISKESFNNILFSNTSYLDSYSKESSIDEYNINKQNNTYIVTLGACGCEASANSQQITKLISAKKNSKNLIIEVSAANLVFSNIRQEGNDNYFVYNSYNLFDENNIIEKEINDILDFNKYNKYQFIFDISNDNLMFVSSNPVK